MGQVFKFHYSKSEKGEYLRGKINKHKARTENVAKRVSRQRGKIKEYREELSEFRGGNDAILEFIPNGNSKGTKIICANSVVSDLSSQFANIIVPITGSYALIPNPERQQFKHFKTNRNRNIRDGFPRDNDTEYKLLEKLVASGIPKDINGQINLYTYYEPCLSCDFVFIQFTKEFPNIRIDLFYESEYKPKER